LVVVKVGFIGAGRRALTAHYPSIKRLSGAEIAAICDLDAGRLNAAGDRFGVERRYTDYRWMLAEAELDVVYVIMPPNNLTPIVIDCLDSGRHVVMEKPPGNSPGEFASMIEAAERNGRWAMVTFQRRFAAIAQEAKRLVLERGPITMCLGEFHKNLLTFPGPQYGVSTLLDDVIHAVDFVTYMCGGEAQEVYALQDRFFADWKNCYNGLVRYSTGAVGVISGNRAAGARYLRHEVHGRGISVYLRLPEQAEVWMDNEDKPIILRGAEIVGSDDKLTYDGTLAMNQHLVECIASGAEPLTSLQNVANTMRLLDAMEGE
jgi:predicted dehydrogenase